jgi:murein DD-endopeptidase MepM/ murein hydrolase activator NlpD
LRAATDELEAVSRIDDIYIEKIIMIHRLYLRALIVSLFLFACSTTITPSPEQSQTPSETPNATLIPTSVPTLTSAPTITPTSMPSPTPCSLLQLNLPFRPIDVRHNAYQDGPRRYGIYWYDTDPEQPSAVDWRGMFDTYDGHRGTDFALKIGDPIYAAEDGVVVIVWEDKVIIDHGCGYSTTYAHIAVSVVLEQIIEQGDQIGEIADVEGIPFSDLHLHFDLEIVDRTNCFYDGHVGCPVDVMTSGLWSTEAIQELSAMLEVSGYGIP